MQNKVFRFFFGKTENKFILFIDGLAYLLLVYLFFVWFMPGVFFRHKYERGSITFRCAGYARYADGIDEAVFHGICDAVADALSRCELYDQNREERRHL